MLPRNVELSITRMCYVCCVPVGEVCSSRDQLESVPPAMAGSMPVIGHGYKLFQFFTGMYFADLHLRQLQ